MTYNEMKDALLMQGIATEEEIDLVSNINGDTEEAMCDILYARAGLRSFDQLEDEY